VRKNIKEMKEEERKLRKMKVRRKEEVNKEMYKRNNDKEKKNRR
jgi:hypothetical protein